MRERERGKGVRERERVGKRYTERRERVCVREKACESEPDSARALASA